MNKKIILSVHGDHQLAVEVTTPIWPSGQVQLKFSTTCTPNSTDSWRTALDVMLTETELQSLEEFVREARLGMEKSA